MKSITVFVMLDACRPDYISRENTPFLKELSDNGYYSPVMPTFGFEPDAAYLAGLYPDQADGGAQFWYAPEESPFRLARHLPKALNRLPWIARKVIRKLIVMAARAKSSSPALSTASIPFHQLSNFSVPMKVNLDEPDFCHSYPTVFDLLRKDKKQWLFHGAPRHKVTMNAACERAQNDLHPSMDFAFFHVGNLDGAGHRFGPDSPEIRRELALVDQGIARIHAIANARFDRVHFVVMGDHGMIRVKSLIDIESVLFSLGISHGKDYQYILDSTMARFWFFSSRAETLIANALNQVPGGRILGEKEKIRYHLNYRHNRFGDIIFLADPGRLIFPNHYQDRDPVIGMHGYLPEIPGQQSVLIINSPRTGPIKKESPEDMRRVFPTLCDLLDIKKPFYQGFESLVSQ